MTYLINIDGRRVAEVGGLPAGHTAITAFLVYARQNDIRRWRPLKAPTGVVRVSYYDYYGKRHVAEVTAR